jgi:ABC-type Zn2+ transport system substrate-binding protein/surface adhesin
MKRFYILILIIGQALALTAWASSPVINEQGTESAHMHLDEHHHGMNTQAHVSDEHEHEHEHGEGCHLHLSVQLNNSGSLTVHVHPSKSIQNSHAATFINRVLTGPPTPPPTA